MLVAIFLLVASTAGQASPTFTSTLVLASAKDLILSGGAEVQANYIRSGQPGQHSVAAISVPLSAGITLTRISFAYRYTAGFGSAGVGVGSNFTLRAAGVDIYESPHCTQYPYSKAHPNYSQPISVNLPASVQVPASSSSHTAAHVEFVFDNNDRNIQLLLPLMVNISCTGGPCAAYPLVPTFIDSNMVLQRAPHRANLWGTDAVPGQNITATLSQSSLNQAHGLQDGEPGLSWSTTAEATGEWTVSMDPQPAASGLTIVIKFGDSSAAGRLVVLRNVAFGDVYFCSGQSNMEFSLINAFNASAEIADSVNYPGLRMFTAAKVAANTPQFNVGDKTGSSGVYANSSWAVSGPAAFSPVGFSWFSAVCYLFGRDTYRALGGKVPIGLVASDWGGQAIEVFSSPDALNDKTCGGTNATWSPVQDEPEHEWSLEGVETSQLWYGMIWPFLRMRFAGVVWYQGEDNSWAPHRYACTFPSMITDWRKKFALPNMSFFFVQLAAYFPHRDFTAVRNAQMAALQLNNTGYAVAIDLGDAHSPAQPIHPRRKQEVGRRLALVAQKVQYGAAGITSTGPEFSSLTVGTDGSSALISFQPGTANGLHNAGTADCTQVGSRLCCGESPFQVLVDGSTGTWSRVNYTIVGQKVELDIQPLNVSTPVAARYAWEAWPQCSMYNGRGGPDDHLGIAATPWCWDGNGPCAY